MLNDHVSPVFSCYEDFQCCEDQLAFYHHFNYLLCNARYISLQLWILSLSFCFHFLFFNKLLLFLSPLFTLCLFLNLCLPQHTHSLSLSHSTYTPPLPLTPHTHIHTQPFIQEYNHFIYKKKIHKWTVGIVFHVYYFNKWQAVSFPLKGEFKSNPVSHAHIGLHVQKMAVQYLHFQVNRNTCIYIKNHKVKKTDKLISFRRTVQHKSWVQQQCYRSLKKVKCQSVWHNIQSLLLGVQSLSQTQKQACRHTSEWAGAHKHIPMHTLKHTHTYSWPIWCVHQFTRIHFSSLNDATLAKK